MLNVEKKLAAALLESVQAENYVATPGGIVFPRESAKLTGTYRTQAHGAVREDHNLVVKEGLIHLLNVALGTTPKPAAYFVALFSGATAPATGWTAATFPTAASELVSLTEGYTLATRIGWTPTNASADTLINNYGNEVEVTFATAGSVTVTGAALLTASGKGATTGVLVSASLYTAPYTFMDGNTFKVGYQLEMTV